jgi:hypothetical protein
MFWIYVTVSLAAFIFGFTVARVFDSRFDKLQSGFASEIKTLKADVEKLKGGLKI